MALNDGWTNFSDGSYYLPKHIVPAWEWPIPPKRVPKTIVLMTALLPTIGHEFLIRFAHNLRYNHNVHVILSSRSFEPISGVDRIRAFKDAFFESDIDFHHMQDDNAPQEPKDHPDFWNVWANYVKDCVGPVEKDDIFVASELYGIEMANALGCQFMPCDIARQVFPIKGTDVRRDFVYRFDQILPAFRPYLQKKVVLFGAESTGKSTMAKTLAKKMNGVFVPEYAREYLETIGTEITGSAMVDIMLGQSSFQKSVVEMNRDKPLIFFDTDLLSTLGYYRIFEKKMGKKLEGSDIIEKYCREFKADLYVVMNDKIPFEPDPIRYGGLQRESNTLFWVELLEEFGCPYILVTSASHDHQFQRLRVDLPFNLWDPAIKGFLR